MSRAHNFCAGPCTLPDSVMTELSDELVDYRGTGMSVVELSHRSAEYEAIHTDALRLFRQLYAVPDEFDILLVQGGATLQFAMVPMNLLPPDGTAGFVVTGSWGRKALVDTERLGSAYIAWNGAEHGNARTPSAEELELQDGTRYLHLTSNETIEGVRFPSFDSYGSTRLVADMSSEYLSRPVDWSLFDLVYGGVQKNLGPAGLAVVCVRRSLIEAAPADLPSYLSFATHAKADSLANTPAMFSIWAMGKMLKWMADQGGVEAMEKRAAERSGLVYETIDRSDGFYRNPVDVAHRSHTNVVFRLPTEELEAQFLAEAGAARLMNLKGHRSVGGMRASIYNGLATQSVEALTELMDRFARRQG